MPPGVVLPALARLWDRCREKGRKASDPDGRLSLGQGSSHRSITRGRSGKPCTMPYALWSSSGLAKKGPPDPKTQYKHAKRDAPRFAQIQERRSVTLVRFGIFVFAGSTIQPPSSRSGSRSCFPLGQFSAANHGFGGPGTQVDRQRYTVAAVRSQRNHVAMLGMTSENWFPIIGYQDGSAPAMADAHIR